MIVVDIDNLACRYPAEIIERHHPERKQGFVRGANGKRGVVGWIEAEGIVRKGDPITLWIPPQRRYVHA